MELNFLNFLSLTTNIVGVIIILWGAFIASIKFLYFQWISIFHYKTNDAQLNYLRSDLASYILMGLEFMIAGDIIHTILKPDKEALIILGSIVAIRTVISYFLNLEQKNNDFWKLKK
ncbi:DUF1622 domain-containing protein [Candidatus Dependentiae bacterium]|nr:DUF1622 domain-containing protein [Candidatus Dependentiae bacterium]